MRRGIFNRVDTYSFTGIIPTPETKQASDQYISNTCRYSFIIILEELF